MRRVVSVWFPHWSTDRLRHVQAGIETFPTGAAPPEPAVTAAYEGSRRVVAAVDPAAQRLGLRPGMALAQATALVPGLHVADAAPEADGAALRRLALWCHRWTPLAAPDPPDGLWLDVTGCAHLFRGEAALLDALAERFTRDGLQSRGAAADTPGAAHAVARHNGGGVVPTGTHAGALAGLPIAALRLAAELTGTLRRLGLERVAHLERLPRAALARRFGPHLLLRLDQAHGRVHEPIIPVLPEALPQVHLPFNEPLLTAEALTTAIGHAVPPLCAQMERAGLGARRLDLLFTRVDGAVQAIRVGTARPTRNTSHLARLLVERIEEVDPGLGIEAMHLLVSLHEPLAWQQPEAAGDAPDVAALVDRLSNRLGAGAVFRAEPVESDVPERSVRLVPPMTQAGAVAWPADWPAPVRLLQPPQPVTVLAELPDGAPRRFIWHGRQHRIRQADGPERVYGEWWRRSSEVWAVRDYFRLEDEGGRRFWLFRRGDGVDPQTGGMEWFLHGLF